MATTITNKDIPGLLAKMGIGEMVRKAIKEAIEPLQGPHRQRRSVAGQAPTISPSRVQRKQTRFWLAFGELLEREGKPAPQSRDPGNAYNSRAWASLGEILEAERAQRAAGSLPAGSTGTLPASF